MKPQVILLIVLAGFLVTYTASGNIRWFLGSIDEPTIYHKDFLGTYLLGRAVLSKENPYADSSDLAAMFIGPRTGKVFPHPSPYPPPNAIVLLPFGAAPYIAATIAWHVVQATCLFLVALLIMKYLDVKHPVLKALATIPLAFAWNPVAEDFTWGNQMLFLLLPLTVSWLCLRRERYVWTGALLGVVVALKLIALPLLVLLALKKKWRAFGASIATAVAANLLAMLIVGFHSFIYYYENVPRLVESLYKARIDNFSLYAVAWRFFEGTGSPIFDTLRVHPLIHAPRLAVVAAAVFPVTALLAALYMAYREPDFDLSFALVVCVCIVAGPLAWRSYLTWLAIPFAVAARQLLSAPQRRDIYVLSAVLVLLLLTDPHPLSLIPAALITPGEPVAPFAVTLFTLVPLATIFVIYVILVALNKLRASQDETI